MNPIRICHFTSTHSPKDQRIFYKECVSLARAGYEVYLVEQGDSGNESGVHIIGTGEQNKGRYYRLLVRPHRVYKLAKKVDADVYHFHDMELLPYGLKLKKQGKKVIFDYHEDYATRFADSDALPGPKWLKKLIAQIYAAYEKYAVRRMDAMISVTPHICDRLTKINPNTVMVTNYPLLNSYWLDESEYNEKSDYMAFAGQISDTYRLSFIAESIQSIPDIRFKICGSLRKQDDLAKIKAVDSKNKVDFIGTLPYMEVPVLLKKARMAINLVEYSSNSNGKHGTLGSNKLFEAMLSGVPVVCTDYDLWEEIIDKHNCGICVNPYDGDALKKAVLYILENPEKAKQMGMNGRKAVLEEYNWATQEVALLQLYLEIGERMQ